MIVGYAYESVAGASVTISAVPEPSTYALFGLGLAGVMLARRRKRA